LKAWLSVLQQTHPFAPDVRLLLDTLRVKGLTSSPTDLPDFRGHAVRFRYEALLEGEDPFVHS